MFLKKLLVFVFVCNVIYGLAIPADATAPVILTERELETSARVSLHTVPGNSTWSDNAQMTLATGTAVSIAEAVNSASSTNYAKASGLQSEGGFSALSMGLLDDSYTTGLEGLSFTSYSFTVLNVSAEPIPLALNFTIFAGQLQALDNTTLGLGVKDQYALAQFIIGSSRNSSIDYPVLGTWNWTPEIRGGRKELTATDKVLDPNHIGRPTTRLIDSGKHFTYEWDSFTQTLDFGSLPPSESFTLYYSIMLFGVVQGTGGGGGASGVFGTAGDPFELVSGNKSGEGSEFTLNAGDQSFPPPSAVPEPSALSALSLGLVGLLAFHRRRRGTGSE